MAEAATKGKPSFHDYAISVSDPKVEEGEYAKFKISLDEAYKGPGKLKVSFHTEDGSAKKNSDYYPASGEVEFKHGQKDAYVTVKTIDDKTPEKTEKFYLKVDEKSPWAHVKDQGECTIYDNDEKKYEKPTAKVWDSSSDEGDKGNGGHMKVKVTLEGDHKGTDVKYYTKLWEANNKDNDYVPTGGTLHFKEGEHEKYIDIPIVGDNKNEENEKFHVYLEHSDKYKFGDDHAICTIVDDDNSVNPTVVGGNPDSTPIA